MFSNGRVDRALSIACSNSGADSHRPLDYYEPLTWLLRDDLCRNRGRGLRRSLFRKCLRQFQRELSRIYGHRLRSDGPLDFQSVYERKLAAGRLVNKLRICAWLHFLRIPAAQTRPECLFRELRPLICDHFPISETAGEPLSRASAVPQSLQQHRPAPEQQTVPPIGAALLTVLERPWCLPEQLPPKRAEPEILGRNFVDDFLGAQRQQQ